MAKLKDVHLEIDAEKWKAARIFAIQNDLQLRDMVLTGIRWQMGEMTYAEFVRQPQMLELAVQYVKQELHWKPKGE